ncbi:MAG: TonB-dependent receptor [Acidobacteria bacterium]|nr:TonB-dependent receptor [Acidobacteriota bacterium]
MLLPLLLLAFSSLYSQTITGSIEGALTDPSGAAIAAAPLRLVQTSTNAVRESVTSATGAFFFTSLPPGEYVLHISAPGFKTLERQAIRLTASELLSLGTLTLEIGQTNEQIVVKDQVVAVQTASSERSGVLTGAQVENIAIRGRNVMNLLRLLPGVVDLSEPDAISRNWNVNVNGLRASTNSVMVDGMTVNAIGNNNVNTVSISLDAVAEVKVLLGNYQAEYGRLSGANVQIVTKSGGRDFHGLLSYFKRHEQFNANNFFNNLLGQPKARYRFNTWNYNIGGPVVLPGFNRDRDKLFFFWSQEFWPLVVNQPITQRTMPSELERRGDFSSSLDVNNRLIVIRDPNSRNPFPNNIIPASQVDPSGKALLSVFPMPNFSDRSISAGRYNYVFQATNITPLRTHTGKIDYNLNPRNSIAGSFTLSSDKNEGGFGLPGTARANWPQMVQNTSRPGRIYTGRYTRVFSPTLINELNIGFSQRPEIDITSDAELTKNQRQTVGFNVPQKTNQTNPLGMLPAATFAGISQPGDLRIEGRFPHAASHDTINITNNLTKSLRSHTLKAGFYIDRIWRGSYNALPFNGSFEFGTNANNPLDTGHPYANALNSVFASYTEASARPYTYYTSTNVEWFVQDNWKVHKRFTLDYGIRFQWIPPFDVRDNLLSSFLESRFQRAKQVQLIRPALVGGRRVGVHPVTGATFPAAAIGAIADGTGDPNNGLLVGAEGTAILNDRGIQLGPRFGFSYDPFGTGKTAVRGGFGLFFNRDPAGFLVNALTQQPIVNSPIVYYSTFSDLRQSTGLSFPQDLTAIDPVSKIPSSMNMSLSIQQNIGFSTILDVGYVGTLGRNLQWRRNLNTIPFGTNFLPQNADPAAANVPLPSSFLRPYLGYGNISHAEFASSSNYHSLQASANRRFSRGFQYGLAYTWSRAMDYSSAEGDNVSNLVGRRVWNYGPSSFDRAHTLRFNWLYDVPNIRAPHFLLRAVLHNWQSSGIYSFSTGQPLAITFSNTVATDITGSPTDGARVFLTGNPNLPESERSFSRNLRTEVVQAPARATIGNSERFPIRGPRNQNWDMTVFKNFPIREAIRVQFRWELYNAWNQTQFSTFDAAARFDPQGRQVNARFGEFTAARAPRVMQFALRFMF